MKKLPAFLFVIALAAPGLLRGADWNQWRGPLRNGVLPDSPRLLDAVPAEGLQELWASEEIPSGDEGGLGSVVTAGGKAFLSLVWHRDVPSETRTIDELVLRKLGHQGTGGLGKDRFIAEIYFDGQTFKNRDKPSDFSAANFMIISRKPTCENNARADSES